MRDVHAHRTSGLWQVDVGHQLRRRAPGEEVQHHRYLHPHRKDEGKSNLQALGLLGVILGVSTGSGHQTC